MCTYTCKVTIWQLLYLFMRNISQLQLVELLLRIKFFFHNKNRENVVAVCKTFSSELEVVGNFLHLTSVAKTIAAYYAKPDQSADNSSKKITFLRWLCH